MRRGLATATAGAAGHLVPEPAFTRNRSMIFSSDDVYPALLAYKYSRHREAGELLRRLSEGYCAVNAEELGAYDYIVPMPWHRNANGGAQFDHIRLLVSALKTNCPDLNFEADTAIIQKTRATASHAGAGRQARLEGYGEMYDALRVLHGPVLRGKRVLIVDDVFTTGTTLSAAAARLVERGVVEVSGLQYCDSPRRCDRVSWSPCVVGGSVSS